MERWNRLMVHPLYRECICTILKYEQERKFCGHSPAHLLDVARIMYIRNLENGYGISKEIIYTTALLHDLGRAKEYADGSPHEEAGAQIAKQILKECDYSRNESMEILDAIRAHRHDGAEKAERPLARLLQEADHLSRNCFDCAAEQDCHWSDKRKNRQLYI
jgi:uncharacterized protein